MSLEAVIEANTSALLKVAELLDASNKGREEAVAKLSEGATTTRKPRTPKDAPADAAKPADVKIPETPPIPAVDAVRAAAVSYLQAGAGPDGAIPEAQKAPRKEFLKGMCEHLGLEKIAEAKPEDRAQVIAWFEAKGRGEAVVFSEGEDDAGEVEPDEDDIG